MRERETKDVHLNRGVHNETRMFDNHVLVLFARITPECHVRGVKVVKYACQFGRPLSLNPAGCGRGGNIAFFASYRRNFFFLVSRIPVFFWQREIKVIRQRLFRINILPSPNRKSFLVYIQARVERFFDFRLKLKMEFTPENNLLHLFSLSIFFY